MAITQQEDLDRYFDDMDALLRVKQQPRNLFGVCGNCGHHVHTYETSGSSYVGARVCDACGAVDNSPVFWETMYGNSTPHKCSNYKRIHHWHERISQLLLLESEIPAEKMLQIAEKLCGGKYTVINKDTVREVLRSLNMQIYIEKWLQIVQRITLVEPPMPGPVLLEQLDTLFQDLQRPFDSVKTPGRKNFLNYNYVFCRLLQKMQCPQFCMFFPLIKSKTKLKALDDMWGGMVISIGWPLTPLQQVAPFSVCLEQPSLCLQRLAARCAYPAPVVRQKVQWKRLDQKSDRPLPTRSEPKPKQHHSEQAGLPSQKFARLAKRPRCT